MVDNRGELNPLNPREYQKQAVEMQKMRIAQQPHLNIPKPAPAPETAKLSALRGALHEIATSKPVKIAVPKGAKATGAGNGGFGKVMFVASIALAPVFLVIGGTKEAIGREYQKLKASAPPILPR